MNIFIIVMFAVMAGLITLLIGQVVYLTSRLDYLEKKYIIVNSDINNIRLEMRGK